MGDIFTFKRALGMPTLESMLFSVVSCGLILALRASEIYKA
jgi:hypothetical protein